MIASLKIMMRNKSAVKMYLIQMAILLTVVIQLSSIEAFASTSACHEIFLANKPQSATLVSEQAKLAAQHYESVFIDQVSPGYESAWNKNLHYYRDFFSGIVKSQSVELTIMKKLGFIFSEHSVVSFPSLSTFIRKYEELLNDLKIPESKRLRPAVVLRNKNTGELLAVRIGIDPWPTDLTGWSFPRDVRLKARAMAENISAGRFPVFSEGLHDVFHLLLFSIHPEYVSLLRSGNAQLLQHMKKGFMSRVAFNLEALSLANPAQVREISKLVSYKNPTIDSRLQDFQAATSKLTDGEVVERARFWGKAYQNYLIHYSAGMREPYERSQYNGLVDSRVLSYKALPNELLASGMAHLDYKLSNRLNAVLNSNSLSRSYLEKMADLRQSLATLEYALWASSSKIDLQQWMSDTMKPEVNPKSPTFQFILDVFGESSPIYQLLVRS